MANMQERLNAAVDRAEVDTGLLHEVVHGDNKSTVNVESGSVPTLAKAIHDIQMSATSSINILNQVANGDKNTVVQTENGSIPSAAKTINDIKLSAVNDMNILNQIANGDVNTVVHTDNGNVPSVAKAIQDIKTDITSGATDVVTAANNSITASNQAVERANQSINTANQTLKTAQNSSQIAVQKSNEAQIWAEGSDTEVETLGGVHSAKLWAAQAKRNVVGSYPLEVCGTATVNQTLLPLTEPLTSSNQVLSVIVENTILLPLNYTLSDDKRSVKLLNPLSAGERWTVKYLQDLQSVSSISGIVIYEDM